MPRIVRTKSARDLDNQFERILELGMANPTRENDRRAARAADAYDRYTNNIGRLQGNRNNLVQEPGRTAVRIDDRDRRYTRQQYSGINPYLRISRGSVAK